MVFTPDAGSGGSSPANGAGLGASLGDMFGSKEQTSAAVDGAKSFRAAAKDGEFRIDPDEAKSAIAALARAEKIAFDMRDDAEVVARPMKIGGSPYAQKAAGWYQEGGESAKKAVFAWQEVLKYTREAYEFAMKNYQSTDADNSQNLRGDV